jgi:phospholipase/carboxylesterase
LIELPPAEGEATKALLVLHGWGANQHDLVPLAQSLKVENCHYFFPNAPCDVPGTGGMGKGWFTFPLNESSERERKASREILFTCLDEIQRKGFGCNQIVLLGFSQGGGMCLDLMLNWTMKVGSVVSLSGFLMDGEQIKERRSLPTDTPVFAAHGLYDPILPLERSKASVQILEECGFDLTWREYPMAHQIVPDEIDDIRTFINRTA